MATAGEDSHGQEQKQKAQRGGCWRHPGERWCWPGPGSSGGGELWRDSGSILKVKLKGFAGDLDVSCAERKESNFFFFKLLGRQSCQMLEGKRVGEGKFGG